MQHRLARIPSLDHDSIRFSDAPIPSESPAGGGRSRLARYYGEVIRFFTFVLDLYGNLWDLIGPPGTVPVANGG